MGGGLLAGVDCVADVFVKWDSNLNRCIAHVLLLQDFTEYTLEVDEQFRVASAAVWDGLAGTGVSPEIICRSYAEHNESSSWATGSATRVHPNVQWGGV